MPPDGYSDVVAQLRNAVMRATPTGAHVLVVSRGDDSLTRIGKRRGWHFPCDGDGRWTGYHPPDSEWAIGHLERLREAGAQFLAFPASSFWWLEQYRELADHLDARYPVVAEHQLRYVIFDLREQAVPVSSNGHRNERVTSPRRGPASRPSRRPRSCGRRTKCSATAGTTAPRCDRSTKARPTRFRGSRSAPRGVS